MVGASPRRAQQRRSSGGSGSVGSGSGLGSGIGSGGGSGCGSGLVGGGSTTPRIASGLTIRPRSASRSPPAPRPLASTSPAGQRRHARRSRPDDPGRPPAGNAPGGVRSGRALRPGPAPTLTGSREATSPTTVAFASTPSATARTTMSRSVSIATRRPSSTTGSDPTSSLFISWAASASDWLRRPRLDRHCISNLLCRSSHLLGLTTRAVRSQTIAPYANMHTEKNPAGEVRGFVDAAAVAATRSAYPPPAAES